MTNRITEISFTVGQKGLDAVFFPYQISSLEGVEKMEKASSRDIWDYVNKEMKISRASVINFMNSMVKHGLVEYTEISGKGGYRRIYTLTYKTVEATKAQIKERLIEAITMELGR